MERDRWAELSAAVRLVDLDFPDNPDFVHPTGRVVRVHLWAVHHNRPTSRACRPDSWCRRTRPPALPHQSCMSRRARTPEFEQFMRLVEARLRPRPGRPGVVKRMDGKPLPIPAHSTDPDAGWGRGAGQLANGYKLHAVRGGLAMPDQWRVAPLDASEQEMARRMLRDLAAAGGYGYVVADKGYDANRLFDAAAAANHQLVCPRRYGPGKGLGHHYQSPGRLRSKDLLERPTAGLTGFGPGLRKARVGIERDFGNRVSFGGGLDGLPAWVRRHGRVRRWVWAKLMINAARIRVNDRKSREAA